MYDMHQKVKCIFLFYTKKRVNVITYFYKKMKNEAKKMK